MELYRTTGIHSAALRCYRIGSDPTVQHLESTGRFESMADIRNVIRLQGQEGGLKALLFVHAEHLPREFTRLLQAEEIFRRFCQVIGFTNVLSEVQLPVYSPLPSKVDDGNATMILSPGFPVTAPTVNMVRSCAFSFDHAELRDFLGSFNQYAGKMLILNLRSHFTTELFPDQLARTALYMAQILARQPLPSPILH